jgi:hypothetical protein
MRYYLCDQVNILHIRALIKADAVLLFDTYGSADSRLNSMFLYHLEVRVFPYPERSTPLMKTSSTISGSQVRVCLTNSGQSFDLTIAHDIYPHVIETRLTGR